MDCPFCQVDNVRTRVFKEGSLVRVLVSNPRLMPGHLLVVPKRHIEKFSELTAEEHSELFKTLGEMQEKILQNISPGCDIRQHYRPFQKPGRIKVNHLHFHLQPRNPEDELYLKAQIHETEMFKDLPPGELQELMQKLGNESCSTTQ